MTTGEDLRRIALSLAGTQEAPHVDRAAFKVARIYATMPPDGLTANLKLDPAEQEFRCLMNSRAFSPVPNAWGRQGWTTITLSEVEPDELASALEAAWRDAQPKPRARRSG
jgi:hypothetical protein